MNSTEITAVTEAMIAILQMNEMGLVGWIIAMCLLLWSAGYFIKSWRQRS